MKQMKRYFKNLWLAITGRNPFREELDEVKAMCKETGEKLQSLHELYYEVVDKWQKAVSIAETAYKKTQDYEKLIENLRERISEKDTLLERTKEDYQEHIKQYMTTIDKLTAERDNAGRDNAGRDNEITR